MNEVEAKASFCRADNMIFAINQNERMPESEMELDSFLNFCASSHF